jgi:hypothetical protein
MMCPDRTSIFVSEQGHDGVVYLRITEIRRSTRRYNRTWVLVPAWVLLKAREMMRATKRVGSLRITKKYLLSLSSDNTDR